VVRSSIIPNRNQGGPGPCISGPGSKPHILPPDQISNGKSACVLKSAREPFEFCLFLDLAALIPEFRDVLSPTPEEQEG
jgi:hypothetical protein